MFQSDENDTQTESLSNKSATNTSLQQTKQRLPHDTSVRKQEINDQVSRQEFAFKS